MLFHRIPNRRVVVLPIHCIRYLLTAMSNPAPFTVMGPGRDNAPKQDLLTPPFLSPTTDKFKWRKQVQLWATTVKRFAKGGDKRARGILNAIGLTLFNALDAVFASKVERAITAGLVSLDLDDDESTNANPTTVVQEIIDIVAKDSPTDGIHRLVQMMRNIYGCTRKNGEDVAIYARRFQSLALDYLNHCDAIAAEQDSQNFAMLLLENANIPSSVYSAVVTQLVSAATARQTDDNGKIYIISKGALHDTLSKLETIEQSHSTQGEDTTVQDSPDIQCLPELQAIKKVIQNAINKNNRHEKEDRASFRVTLDDAVEALADVKVDDNRDTDAIKLKTNGTMMGKRSYNDSNDNSLKKFPRNTRNKIHIPNGEGPKARTRCRACGKPNHWYKDPECIYNVMRNVIEGNKVEQGIIDKQSNDVQALFNKASNSKTNVRISDIVNVIGDAKEGGPSNKSEHDKANKGVFSVEGLDRLLPDPNPILDEGAPTSTGGIENAATLCDILGIPLVLDPPRDNYLHGWGDECLGAKPIVRSWTLTVHDVTEKPTALTFDLVQGSSPLIVGMDVRAYCNTYNLGSQRYILMKRPTDTEKRTLFTYIVPDDKRLRLDIAPHPRSVVTTLLGNICSSASRAPLVFSKRIHRYTHASKDETKSLCRDANILNEELEQAIDKVHDACEICAKNGRPKSSKKVSLSHVNTAFNQEIQIDFFFITLRGTKFCVINITDTGTGYTVLAIAPDRSTSTIIRLLETEWICHHGAPHAASADDEYNRAPVRNYLSSHDITFKPRPARRHNKTGIVERKNQVVKTILSKLDADTSEGTPVTLVSRAAFLSNMFSGNRTLSSFELVRGYSPSVVGIPKTVVTEELLQAHKEQVAVRTLQRLMTSHAPQVARPSLFNPGDPVWVCYNTSKQNEPVQWIKASVVDTEEHALVVRGSAKGRPMRVAYEDVRYAPRGPLTEELLSSFP